jgi:hypothetical protein
VTWNNEKLKIAACPRSAKNIVINGILPVDGYKTINGEMTENNHSKG